MVQSGQRRFDSWRRSVDCGMAPDQYLPLIMGIAFLLAALVFTFAMGHNVLQGDTEEDYRRP